MRHSLYWDDFERRAEETVQALRHETRPTVRRIAVFVTDRCSFRCSYCNYEIRNQDMTEEEFDSIVQQYGDGAIIHITGGEPSVVRWLYPYLRAHGDKCRFHLNTNAFVAPPSESIQRLKVSLDSYDREYWNALVGVNAFDRVVQNIKDAIPHTVVSITYTMSHENMREIPEFIRFVNREFPGLYATFFSVYKGDNKRFVITPDDAELFFNEIKPQMEELLDAESAALLNETVDEKFRIMQDVRFPGNDKGVCYLSLSERVFAAGGQCSACSHLWRDGVNNEPGSKFEQCTYGCNQRLAAFNKLVEQRLLA